ncbi:MAG TPA: ATP-binding cassette domain-containing protein [Candidatus Krumholzibacteria bacterium]|nr:ATP-binding cassette domain-containing protein [Candidatus Krumholzibacteria bacterium]
MIQVKDVTKVYGPTMALDHVSFEVGKRQILGFLGPNGAGKSTAMKIITSYIAPTEGSVTVGGIDVAKDPISVRRLIGYLPETTPLYEGMQVDQYLRFCAKARGLAGARLNSRLDWVVQQCGLEEMFKKDINQLSKGFKQRTGLAQALIHDPEILILDEPTTGLDPLQIIQIRKLIQELAHEKTVIFSTHILQEVSSTTDRVIIINNGRIIADGYLNDLQSDARGGAQLRVALTAGRDEVERGLISLDSVAQVNVVSEAEGVVTARLRGTDGVNLRREVGQLAAARSWPVMEMGVPEVSLEDAFIEYIRRSNEQHGKEARHV